VDKQSEQSNLPDKFPVKINKAEMLKLYFINGLSESEIARHFKVKRQSINGQLKPFKELLRDRETIEFYRSNKVHFFDAIEQILTTQLADKEKLKKASTNNIAYALRQVHEMNRLEKGQATQRIAHENIDFSKMETSEVIKSFNTLIRDLNIFVQK